MRVAGVICECNPLHEGHKYIFSKAREKSDVVIAIMSGNFVQRSEVAIFDKYTRASDLIENGVDLVIELPFPWSSASAEFFARAGVSIASKIGVTELYFGVENDDMAMLKKAASKEISKYIENELKNTKDQGSVYIKNELSNRFGISEDLFVKPNNILAIEYIKAINDGGYKININPVKRIESISASEIRNALLDNQEKTNNLYLKRMNQGTYSTNAKLFDLEWHNYLLNENIDYENIFESKGGLGKRLKKCAVSAKDGDEMIALAATKKYTNSRIRRTALYTLLKVEEHSVRKMPKFSLLLGANAIGREYLSKIETQKFIITKPSDTSDFDDESLEQIKLSQSADMVYTLCYENKIDPNYFVKKSPFIK